ncbi:MAG: MBOAT family protein [Oscillospiraceae bacterium]|nr:MBOAT family protein [Oscillospiraceae bacterium]
MSIISVGFVIFAAALLIVYYLVPKKAQWWVLLAASLLFYALGTWRGLIYLAFTSFSAWAAALWIEKDTIAQKAYLRAHKAELSKEEKTAYRSAGNRRRRRLMALCMVLSFLILVWFKYIHFLLAQANAVAGLFGGRVTDTITFIVPLGLSFYTFQTMGYVADVYWERFPAQKNPLKLLLFTSFFPQITQGPISTYQDLGEQLFTPHFLDDRAVVHGGERMLWGFFKKMVVANMLSPYVRDVFANYSGYAGAAVLLGAFCYSAQIYADFSGYMDIMCGYCQMLGIRLTENFERPYFSKSVAEYWRRWHISLGAWFKTYVYFPIAMARWNQRLGRNAKKQFGKTFGDYLPATLALVVVWLATGLWHGASWTYILWGGLNGLFIIASLWLEKPFDALKKHLRIDESAWLWRAFQVLRTFLLVTLIKVLPEVGTLSDGLGLWGRIFRGPLPNNLAELIPFADKSGSMICVLVGVGLMLVVSLLQRRGSVRELIEKRLPSFPRLLLYAALFFAIVYYGVPASGGLGGFLYAQF